MKTLFKNKKFIIGIFAILLIVIAVICILLFYNKDNKQEDKILKKDEFVAFVKINPLVKLTFKSSYYECEDKDGKVSICEKFTNEVIEAEFLNDDAKSIYKKTDFKGKTLNDAIVLIAKIAENKDYDIKNINITTNWNYDIENMKKTITEKIKEDTKVEVEIKFNYQEKIDENAILKNENVESYTVNFNTDGGTNVESQTIVKNNKVNKPTNPSKKGYTFDSWYLDDKKYDFNSNVTKDITLIARWKKETSTNSSSNTTNNTTNNNTNNNQTEVSQKEKDNETLKQQLIAKGLVWDFNTKEEAYRILDLWSGGYGGEVLENSYGESDTAYTVQITLNTEACGGQEILNIDWRNSQPIDFIYYLHSKGYNCSGNTGYHNGKSFHVNDKNEIVWD